MGFAAKEDVPQPAVAGQARRKQACGGIRQRPDPTAVA